MPASPDREPSSAALYLDLNRNQRVMSTPVLAKFHLKVHVSIYIDNCFLALTNMLSADCGSQSMTGLNIKPMDTLKTRLYIRLSVTE